MSEAFRLMLEDGMPLHDRTGRPVQVPEPQVPLADTHGHLTCFRTVDVAEALCRAALVGVRLLVVPIDPVGDFGSDETRWHDVAGLLAWLDGQAECARVLLATSERAGLRQPTYGGDVPQLLDNVRIVAGVHPYGALRVREPAVRERLEALLASPRCVGVGEIGLDAGPYAELALERQEQALRWQLTVARERHLPVELHLRDGEHDTAAHDLAAHVLAEEGVPQAGCDLHCFTQGPEVLRPFAELGCHIAFGGAATFKRSDAIRAAAAACPAERMLSETDCPYMAPVPLRGRECEPAMVALTSSLLADVRERELGVSRTATYRALWRNACTLFGLQG